MGSCHENVFFLSLTYFLPWRETCLKKIKRWKRKKRGGKRSNKCMVAVSKEQEIDHKRTVDYWHSIKQVPLLSWLISDEFSWCWSLGLWVDPLLTAEREQIPLCPPRSLSPLHYGTCQWHPTQASTSRTLPRAFSWKEFCRLNTS